MKKYFSKTKQTPHYDLLAPFWDELCKTEINYENSFVFIDQVVRDLGLGKTILDLSCGTGTLLAFFEQAGYKTYGVEASKNMLAIARKRLKKTICEKSDFNFIPFNEMFDVIYNHYNDFAQLLRYEDLVAVLRYLKTKLVPNGVLIFDLITYDKSPEEFYQVKNCECKQKYLSLITHGVPYENIMYKNYILIVIDKSKGTKKRKQKQVIKRYEKIEGIFTTAEVKQALVEAGFKDISPTIGYLETTFIGQNIGL